MLVQGERSQCFCSLRVLLNFKMKIHSIEDSCSFIHSMMAITMVENIYLKFFNNNNNFEH